jgi:hypothetical protein
MGLLFVLDLDPSGSQPHADDPNVQGLDAGGSQPYEDTPNVGDGLAEPRKRASKRKAEVTEDSDQDTSQSGVLPCSNIGTQSSELAVESRVLTVLQSLGRRHKRMVDSRIMAFVRHHERCSQDDPPSLYLDSHPARTANDLVSQIGRLEQEIHYGLDLYHTSLESRGLGSGQLPAPRVETWFDRLAQARYKKRPAL